MNENLDTTSESSEASANSKATMSAKTPAPGAEPSGVSRGLLVILAIAVILASSLAALFYYQNTRLKSELAANLTAMQSPEPTNVPVPSATPDPMADWEIYNNTEYGFSFMYPSEFYTEVTDGVDTPLLFISTQPITIPSGYGGWLTPIEVRTPPITNTHGSLNDAEATFSQDYTINNKKEFSDPVGVLLSGVGKEGTPFVDQTLSVAYFERNGLFIEFDYTHHESIPEETFNQILSTFKFLDESDTIEEATESANGQQ